MGELSHFDEHGAPRMVDVSAKPETAREARARATVRMKEETLALILANRIEKGDVLQVARLAGIQAVKRTAELIPLCHPLRVTSVDVALAARGKAEVGIETVVRAFDRTGVEMEALVAASVAALTVYDMIKAVDRWVVIEKVELVEKSGGKSGSLRNPTA
ncbi:MAG TPA: cyclic pyranopterin monophosphate synthase MoaC [Planctomycetota bacterium]|nr:cyclic pyranopterin monophosphate synthase MoaC [Planctomycetota bacterium]